MDNARSALVPIAADFRLSGSQTRQALAHVAGRWGKVLAEALGLSLARGRDGLFGLPHDPNTDRSRFAEGWSIYPPCLMGAPTAKSIAMQLLFLRRRHDNVRAARELTDARGPYLHIDLTLPLCWAVPVGAGKRCR
jgi:hypothetical protein